MQHNKRKVNVEGKNVCICDNISQESLYNFLLFCQFLLGAGVMKMEPRLEEIRKSLRRDRLSNSVEDMAVKGSRENME